MSKRYGWNIYTIIDKIEYLKRTLKRENDSQKIMALKKDIALLESYLEEINDSFDYETPKLLEIYNYYKELLAESSCCWSDITEFGNASFNDLDFRYIPEIKRINLSKKDILELTHDFYKSLNPFFFGNFMKQFYRRFDHVRFVEPEGMEYDGFSICMVHRPEAYIEIVRQHTIEDVITTIHEYSHATSSAINPNHLSYPKDLFVEFDSLFMELIANDFLKSVTKSSDLTIVKGEEFLKNVDMALEISDLISLFEAEESLPNGYTSNKVLKKTAKEECALLPIEVESLLRERECIGEDYVISYLLAIELYKLYKEDKDKALYLLKKFILLECNSVEQYYSNIKRLGFIPNLSTREFQHDLDLELKRTLSKPRVAKK